MSVELIKDFVNVTALTKIETSQVVKERDIIVPDGKPDIQRVLSVDGKIRMDQMDVQSNRIVYRGQIDVTILYAPADAADGVVKMTGTVPLEDFMIIEGVEPYMVVDFGYSIENMHWNLLNERKINVKAIIELEAEVTDSKEVAVISDLSTDAPVQKKMEQLEIVTESPAKEVKVIVKDELTIPQGKEPIGEILKMDVVIKDEQVKRTPDEIIFNGIVEVSTLYQTGDDEKDLEVVVHKVPFTGEISEPKGDDEVY